MQQPVEEDILATESKIPKGNHSKKIIKKKKIESLNRFLSVSSRRNHKNEEKSKIETKKKKRVLKGYNAMHPMRKSRL